MTGRPSGATLGGLAEAAVVSAQPPVAWYLGREGQQFGPVNDAEFRRLFDGGQLLPTDLVWREGFAEWLPVASLQLAPLEPAPAVPPPPPPPHRAHQEDDRRDQASEHHLDERPAPRAQQRTIAADASSPRAAGRSSPRTVAAEPRPEPRRRKSSFLRVVAWVAILAFFVITLGAAYLVVAGDRNLLTMAKAIIPSLGGRIPATAPIGGFASTPEATDIGLQKSRLWQVLKQYHPEWYADRVREVTEAKRADKSDKDIANSLMQAVVSLRRKFAGDATSAPYARLKSIATLFTSNLTQMRAESIDTCYQFVSAGEGAPAVVAMLQSPEHTSALQAQLVEIFEAITEGRRAPRVYPAPKPQDYDALVKILEERGWKNKDMQLFSDSAALAKASPETVCRLVSEWFESQLKIQDQDLQLRLIVDSLKPVVAG